MTDTTPGPDAPDAPGAPAAPPGARRLFASRGWRFGLMILLTLLMVIPLTMIAFVIEDRAHYQRQAVAEVARQWGGAVELAGPVLVVPVVRAETRRERDADGRLVSETVTVAAEPLVVLPRRLAIEGETATEIRSRGIFDVPVFTAAIRIAFSYALERPGAEIGPRETILWDKASVALVMARTRSFTGAARLVADGRDLALEPGTPLPGRSGIQAFVGDPRGLGELTLTMELNGAQRIGLVPAGRQTDVRLTGDWPHPSFDGAFLPKSRDVGADGFRAVWQIPHLARGMPEIGRGFGPAGTQFGMAFYNPVDFYQKAARAAKYGILFVALTFLTVFLIERLAARPAHPAQLILIGLAECVFFLLLLSIAEQIGFAAAYAVAAAATILLIGLYGRAALGLVRPATALLVGALALLYAVLYLILRSTDYALLAGSLLCFVAVALAMAMTRGDDWSASAVPPARP